jgi:hypothetical protein
MKTSERFNRAVQALVSSYFNSTLVKGNCSACAVGNIVAAGIEGKVYSKEIGNYITYRCDKPNYGWRNVFLTVGDEQGIWPHNYEGIPKEIIDATGYSWEQLAMVEKTFEVNTKIFFDDYKRYTPEQIDADQYEGLMAVVDVLCQIEGIDDASEYKALFAGKILV